MACAIKRFDHLMTIILSDTCGLYYKTFRIVIYDGNDSTIVEPVL